VTKVQESNNLAFYFEWEATQASIYSTTLPSGYDAIWHYHFWIRNWSCSSESQHRHRKRNKNNGL